MGKPLFIFLILHLLTSTSKYVLLQDRVLQDLDVGFPDHGGRHRDGRGCRGGGELIRVDGASVGSRVIQALMKKKRIFLLFFLEEGTIVCSSPPLR